MEVPHGRPGGEPGQRLLVIWGVSNGSSTAGCDHGVSVHAVHESNRCFRYLGRPSRWWSTAGQGGPNGACVDRVPEIGRPVAIVSSSYRVRLLRGAVTLRPRLARTSHHLRERTGGAETLRPNGRETRCDPRTRHSPLAPSESARDASLRSMPEEAGTSRNGSVDRVVIRAHALGVFVREPPAARSAIRDCAPHIA